MSRAERPARAGRSLPRKAADMDIQFDTRRDAHGWTVFDRWTGRIVVVARAAQQGMSFIEADDLAHKLNRRRLDGDRTILQ
jgi:hypothetical protein